MLSSSTTTKRSTTRPLQLNVVSILPVLVNESTKYTTSTTQRIATTPTTQRSIYITSTSTQRIATTPTSIQQRRVAFGIAAPSSTAASLEVASIDEDKEQSSRLE